MNGWFVQTIGQCGRGRLVDDTQHLKTGNLAGVLGRLTLGVVEIGRNGDHGLGHVLAQIAFGGLFHLTKNESRNLSRGVLLTLGFDPRVTIAAVDHRERQVFLVLGQVRVVIATTDQALDAKNRVVGVGHGLTFCRHTDQTLVIRKGDDRRGCAGPFRVFDDPWLRAVHDGDTRVRCAKVDSDYFTHSI